MLMKVLLLICIALAAGLGVAAWRIRRRQQQLRDKSEAASLQRRADHLFKVALAAQVHTRNNGIARALLNEAIRVLDNSAQLDPAPEATTTLLNECHSLLGTTEQEHPARELRDPLLEFPETELIEAQLHLTEASRLLLGLEKRGLVGYDALKEMLSDLKQAQRALDLRLQLRQAAASPGMQRTVEQVATFIPTEKTQPSR